MAEFSRLVVPKAPRTVVEGQQQKESTYWRSFRVSLAASCCRSEGDYGPCAMLTLPTLASLPSFSSRMRPSPISISRRPRRIATS